MEEKSGFIRTFYFESLAMRPGTVHSQYFQLHRRHQPRCLLYRGAIPLSKYLKYEAIPCQSLHLTLQGQALMHCNHLILQITHPLYFLSYTHGAENPRTLIFPNRHGYTNYRGCSVLFRMPVTVDTKAI